MNKIKLHLKYLFYTIFTLFPIKKNKIICNNFMGKGFGDNPKYIVNELIRQNVDCDIVWVCKPEFINTCPKEVRVETKWYKILFEFATAKVWIGNMRLPLYLRKRKNQFYIQAWHGAMGLKKAEKDVINSLSKGYVKEAKHDGKQTDLMINNSTFFKKIFETSFWYDGLVLCDGLPRNDFINKKNTKRDQKIIKKYGLEGHNILLYAPTFRKEMKEDTYNINLSGVIKTLKKKTNTKWKVIVKLHPNIDDPNKYIKFDKNIINVSDYDDVNDLFGITDIMISDYSSVMFDFMFTSKPVFIYATDIEEYKKDRDFYIKLEEVPFTISTNNKKLLENIKEYDIKKLKKEYKKFFEKYGAVNTGKASSNIVEIIKEKIK